ncbi:lytic transglycosylase domain-containing protein [Burkholderia vietnamiensis]|uniref:lytic transglycosylase domain-containing protein n=1 Tax=Burkholderia vietnamiensis TaxID=60552 RepID=UPI00159383E3|nr:lytic transglycosylase domain-containing protein [Burkholderia vietnamiensis]MCA8270714.1 lytic transglycosylase domain-containing protein [Burkholderia vietnamiensis]
MTHNGWIKHLAAAIALTLHAAAQAQSLEAIMATCAPNVHPTTMAALVQTESKGNPYSLSDSGLEGLPWSERKKTIRSLSPSSAEDAEKIAADLIARGHIVDIGLTQVSSRNLARLRLSVREVLDPCTNVRAGGQILSAFYRDALPKYRDSNAALLAALSAYNTGNFSNGLSNGYVDRVLAAGGMRVPALRVPGVRRISAMADAPGRHVPFSSKFAVLDATVTQ